MNTTRGKPQKIKFQTQHSIVDRWMVPLLTDPHDPNSWTQWVNPTHHEMLGAGAHHVTVTHAYGRRKASCCCGIVWGNLGMGSEMMAHIHRTAATLETPND